MNVFLALIAVVVALAAALLVLLFLFTRHTVRKIEAGLPPTGRFVDVPGARLHVIEQGQGQPVLLVHGLSGQLANFAYGMVEPLARDFRVVAVDRPAAGWSTREPGAPADLRAQADTLAALIDKLGLEKPLVVGHSLGGAIALALATHHPERVGGLALIAPLTHPPQGNLAGVQGHDDPEHGHAQADRLDAADPDVDPQSRAGHGYRVRPRCRAG